MKLGIILYSNDEETIWNALRLGNFALDMKDEVDIFLIGKGVEIESFDSPRFEVSEQLKTFVEGGGKVFACGTCLELRKLEAPRSSKVATLKELYEIIRGSDKVIAF